MGKAKTITRRSFLVTSAVIGGGVVFGGYFAGKPHKNPLIAASQDGEAVFNPWIAIDAEKITLITPHADKGQGVTSAQAALLAEELDVDFGQFETSFGVPSPAYWNRAMADEAVPFKSTDDSRAAETMRGIMGGVMKMAGMQGTGGSTAMPDSFDKLRQAGASARETLKLAASNRTGIPVDQLTTRSAAVILPDGTKLAYTDLAADAAGLDPVQNVPLRSADQWRLIGKPMQRLDIIPKSTGTLPYGIDVQIDGMLHATVRTNPYQGGGMTGFDATAAETMPGVKKIMAITGGVAVVADNTWRAFQAIDAVEIDWKTGAYPAQQPQHWDEVANCFVETELDSKWRDDGDAAAAISGGTAITAEYKSPYVAHAPLEPLNATILITDDRVDVWTGHQVPILLVQLVAKLTGHGTEQVHFHNQYIGGSFGHRLEFDWVLQTAEIANEMRGTPIKMTYSREEDFAHDYPRHIAIGRATGSVEEGKVESIDLQIAAPSVFTSQMARAGLSVPGPDAQIAAGSWNNPYAIPNYRMRAYRAPELAPVSSWRAVGAPGAGFFFDCFLDELIHKAGADPMAERIRLMDHDPSRKVLETVAQMSNWDSPLPEGSGRGVAFVESFGVPVAEVVEVTNTNAGIRIDKVWIAADVGTVIDPVNFENLAQGGVVFGLGHAMNCEITYDGGVAEQTNYHAHEGMRMYQAPQIFVKGLENGRNVRGFGEPPVPPAAPALANAIFAATGQRIREMPFHNHIDFV